METTGRTYRLWVVTAAALAALVFSLLALHRAQSTNAQGDEVRLRIGQLVRDHQRLEAELTREPFADAGRSSLQSYLARIRRDGAPHHTEMRRRLAALAENNVALLALAEAYEPFAGHGAYGSQLRALRSYVITWNERWNTLFEVFMAGGDLAASESPFPRQFGDLMEGEPPR